MQPLNAVPRDTAISVSAKIRGPAPADCKLLVPLSPATQIHERAIRNHGAFFQARLKPLDVLVQESLVRLR